MATARALLARVHKLGQDRAHPVLALLGGEQGWQEVQAEAEDGIAAGRYDRKDISVVVTALRTWLGTVQPPLA